MLLKLKILCMMLGAVIVNGEEYIPSGETCTSNSECFTGCCMCDPGSDNTKCVCAFAGEHAGYIGGQSDCGSHGRRCKDRVSATNKCWSKCSCWPSTGNCLCEPDSPVQGKIGSGGQCKYDSHCYSGKCQKTNFGKDGYCSSKV